MLTGTGISGLMVLTGSGLIPQDYHQNPKNYIQQKETKNLKTDGRELQVILARSSSLRQNVKSPLSTVILLGGLMIGLSSALTLYFARSSKVKSQQLEEINQKLILQIRKEEATRKMLEETINSLRLMAGEDADILLAEVFNSYLEDAPQRLQAIQDAITNQDALMLQKSAHALKSLSVTVGAVHLAELAGELEVKGRTGLVGHVESLIEQLTLLTTQLEETNQKLAIANQELQRLALIDGLTQISNRRCFDEYLQEEWKRLKREKLPLSLILCDLDFFKAYNDTYGHQAGDECLKIVACILTECARRSADLVARYGGEEFAIILPNTPIEGAMEVAQRARKLMKEKMIIHQGSIVEPYLTLSLGLTTIIPHAEASIDQFIFAADQALYQAKLAGRNRIEVNHLIEGNSQSVTA